MNFLMQWELGRTQHTLLHTVRERQSKTAAPIRRSFRGSWSGNYCTPNLSILLSPCPLRPCIRATQTPHTGQSSQLASDANDGNAQSVRNPKGGVTGRQGTRASKSVLSQPTVDTLRNFATCNYRMQFKRLHEVFKTTPSQICAFGN